MKFVVLLLFISNISIAQNPLTENFAYSVKTIDDFIDRFDFKPETEFMNYFHSTRPGEKIDRQKMLLSLFNFRNKSFYGNDDVKSFISNVTDSLNPFFITFSDSSWFAEVECKVSYKSKPQSLTLILKVEKDINNSVKWSIVSAHAPFLGTKPNDSLGFVNNSEYMKNRINDHSRYFLHPVSHALAFMNIDQLFSTSKNVFENYVYEGPHSYELESLISKVKKSEIKFIQVNTISYHFLQIGEWIMIVDYFNREENNSGWLINTLVKAKDDQKKIYLEKHLNVPVVK